MKKCCLVILLFFFFFLNIVGQIRLSKNAQVSIITAAKGEVLYESFGHSAIRVKDSIHKLDLIYNYGIFDFNAPNFYTNFVKGRLLYELRSYNFNYFLFTYSKDKRWVKEQVLNLNTKEKQAYFNFLEDNALPENRKYLYDPFFNNCATKLRDITKSILKEQLTFNNNHLEKGLSFRTLMNRELLYNTWGSLGINIALGSKLDAVATPLEYMYLPKYVFLGFNNTTNKNNKLVLKENTLLNYETKIIKNSILNPYLSITLLSLLGVFITYKDFKKKRRTKLIDFLVFFITGITGILIGFLWFFTNHSTTQNNFNFLWAFAPNFFIAFLVLKNLNFKWLIYYLLLMIILLLLLIFIWIIGLQVFHNSLIPFLFFIFFRYIFLIYNLKETL